MTAHVRALAPGDRDALATLLERARDRGELAGFSPWMEQGFRIEHLAPDTTFVAEDAGHLVGLVTPQMKALLVEPDHRRRGIGSSLVEAGLAIEEARGNGTLYLGVRPGDEAGEAFLRATGFAFHSSVVDLELPAGAAVGPIDLPEGFRSRAFDRERDVDAWATAFNESFVGHPTPIGVDPAELRQWVEDPGFRDEDTILVTAPEGAISGFASIDPGHVRDGSVPQRGEVWALAVAPSCRGRGLGRALLRLAIGRLREMGVEIVTLSVSSVNRRAGALYEAEGFVPVHVRDRWARGVGPRR